MRLSKAILSLGASLLLAGTAHAQTTGTVTLNSEAGDYIGMGEFYSYDDTNASLSTSSDGSLVTVNVYPTSGGWWTINLAAPPGVPMAVGAYENAVRAAFRPAGTPGIDAYGMGRGCNETAGRFDVSEITFGPNNYVASFSASFEQHCEWSGAPALRGEVQVQNPPPPPALELSFSLTEALFNKVTGAALLRGTVSCNRAVDPNVSLSAIQRISRTQTVIGGAYLQVQCTAPGTAVEIPLNPPSGSSFVKGRPMEISVNLNTYDPAYNTWVSKTSTEVVKLK
jgi:hypothetical protein